MIEVVNDPDDYACSMRDPPVHKRRVAMLDQPHIRPLTAYVSRLGAGGRGYVPHFDPLDGGVEARLLFLFEKPGPKTVPPAGSGFISRNNDDPSARHTHTFMMDAGIPRRATAIWNTIPWWTGRIRVTAEELQAGAAEFRCLLQLLPALRGVVLVGNRAAEHGAPMLAGTDLLVHRTVHTSMQARNGLHSREGWLKISENWKKAWEAVCM